jgi:hypothetical protein
MTNLSRSIADSSARPAVEVRLDGRLIRRISEGEAKQLIDRGWGEWIGEGRRRYVRLTEAAPISAFPSWRGPDGTRPVRGQHGQLLGDPEKLREFCPISKTGGS